MVSPRSVCMSVRHYGHDRASWHQALQDKRPLFFWASSKKTTQNKKNSGTVSPFQLPLRFLLFFFKCSFAAPIYEWHMEGSLNNVHTGPVCIQYIICLYSRCCDIPRWTSWRKNLFFLLQLLFWLRLLLLLSLLFAVFFRPDAERQLLSFSTLRVLNSGIHSLPIPKLEPISFIFYNGFFFSFFGFFLKISHEKSDEAVDVRSCNVLHDLCANDSRVAQIFTQESAGSDYLNKSRMYSSIPRSKWWPSPLETVTMAIMS